MKLEIKGHSGCQVEIVNENGQVFVYKSTQKPSYFNRLKLQGMKQMQATEVGIPHINVPEVLDINTTDDSVTIKMPYVYSKSFVSYFEYAGFEQINHFIESICGFLSYEIHKSPIQTVKANVLKEKFADVKKNTLSNPHLKGNRDIERIIKLSEKYFEYAEDMQLPVGKCHGDLTFSNVLFSGNNYYLIDFLDSFVESPLLDIVKIRQDSAYMWSELMYSGECDSLRLRIVADKIDAAIDEFASQFDWYRHYKIFQLMNFLRILQYAHEGYVINYLTNVLNDLLYEL